VELKAERRKPSGEKHRDIEDMPSLTGVLVHFRLTRIQRHSGQALASHPVPGTDLGTLFASIDLASHPVPGTDLGTLSELLYDNLHCRVSVSSCRQAQRTLP
jgi:hypothetical protein